MLDEGAVRERIDAHARGILAGDLEQAAADFSEDFGEGAAELVARLPHGIRSVELTGLQRGDGELLARVRYTSDEGEATVEQRWEERAGRPLIVEAKVLPGPDGSGEAPRSRARSPITQRKKSITPAGRIAASDPIGGRRKS